LLRCSNGHWEFRQIWWQTRTFWELLPPFASIGSFNNKSISRRKLG
jgi:hypothetical protein